MDKIRIGHILLYGRTSLEELEVVYIEHDSFIVKDKENKIKKISKNNDEIYSSYAMGIDMPETQDESDQFLIESQDEFKRTADFKIGTKVSFSVEYMGGELEIKGYVLYYRAHRNVYECSEIGVSVPDRRWLVGAEYLNVIS